ncbi:C-terminal binding protein [Blastococcus sp. CT_GayMR20]|uniref:C-terminal binding protein n=1 Tax=Blastococcus sp. CT_GayMR20 TaxID=2559609 RepID=UPI001073564F|nr:C-terminal binding protein [Blastococcus sp. CT_GayMR20]TFV70588.1 C-terminal binding protein [Blastococcus sp. CT_GayMR20]
MTRLVVVTDQAFGGVEREAAIAAGFGARFAEHHCRTEKETIAAVAGASVAFVNFAPITESVLERLKPEALVIRYGIGVDNVDLDAARRLGVSVANVPDYGSDTVADHAAASLLALLRRIPHYDRAIRADGWTLPTDVGPVVGFGSTTVGLVGTGRIGLALAGRLVPFGIRVIAHDPYADADLTAAAGVELVGLDELLTSSHGISLHAPLTDETRRLINADTLARMRPGAVLVNTARGGLVDSLALAGSLERGHLAGAALDVMEPEPLPLDSPLRTAPGVVLTPHAAFYSDDSLAALQRLAAEEAGRYLAGQPLRCRVV